MTTIHRSHTDEVEFPAAENQTMSSRLRWSIEWQKSQNVLTTFNRMHQFIGTLVIVALLSFHSIALADSDVPAGLQADLIAKLAAFDRNLPARANGTVRVMVVHKNGDGRSTRVAKEVANALKAMNDIAGMGKDIRELAFGSAAEIVAQCKSQHISIIYFAPGLQAEMTSLAQAISGVDVMTVGPSGAVVGFTLEESKPKILVNLARAKSQNVALKAQVLKLARIVE